jgi:hypothetical protein
LSEVTSIVFVTSIMFVCAGGPRHFNNMRK